MYKKVIVPLDGSDLAEATLPHLEEIARGCNVAEIMLLSVTEEIKGDVKENQAFEEYVPENPPAIRPPVMQPAQFAVVFDAHEYNPHKLPITMGKMGRTAAQYLAKVADRLGDKGFNVSAAVVLGDPAGQIVRYANEQKADLIVMASTGKSKISRWDMSHIAARVIKETCVPVLLVKPESEFKETKAKRKGTAM